MTAACQVSLSWAKIRDGGPPSGVTSATRCRTTARI
jgi:hypothetical protein